MAATRRGRQSEFNRERRPGKLTFNITVDDIIAMEKCECSKQLASDEFSVAFVDNAAFAGFHLALTGEHPKNKRLALLKTYQGSNAATLCKVHCNPDSGSVKPATIVTRYVISIRATELAEEGNLLSNIFDVVICNIEIDDLEGNNESGRQMDTLVDGPIRALADHLKTSEYLGYWEVRFLCNPRLHHSGRGRATRWHSETGLRSK